MNLIRLWLILPLLLTVASCRKKETEAVHAISGEYLPLAGGSTGLGGDLDGEFRFVVLPAKGGQAVLGGQAFGGVGYKWSGVIRFQNRKDLPFEVTCDRSATGGTAVFGVASLDLGKGEVLFVASDGSVKQIPGSKAGKKKDPENLKRLDGIHAEQSSGDR
jgi:hypothetical protein